MSEGVAHGDGHSKEEQPTTTEYGVSITLKPDSKYRNGSQKIQYWTAEANSVVEAKEMTRREYDNEIAEMHGVDTREVPEPEGWSQ